MVRQDRQNGEAVDLAPHQKNPFQSLFADKLVIEVEVKRKVNSHGRHTHTDTLPHRE